ncbi:F-box domain containing protein [Trema orientale]|uniref:F-box domain containing protein n=1 Tax=Trema orientale TaxID=63057 RepID=A0A2P5FXA9_TREOI|nr:F-box domain containing protein [Trema orientale]
MEENLDLISNLPPEILRYIISFIPLKEAVRSSTLSTTWRQVLAPIPVTLEAEIKGLAIHEARKEVSEVLGRFLSSYSCPERWKLSLGVNQYKKDCLIREDDELVVLATKGVEKELHLSLFEQSHKGNDKPFHLELQPKSSPNNLQNHPTQSASFSSLRTLHLRSVNNQVTNLVSDLFAGCHLLESLKLEKCVGLQELDVEMSSLRSLEVMDCPGILSITVSAPKLKSFWYRGILPAMQLKSAFDLVEANLDLEGGIGLNEFDCEEVLCLLASLKEVQILTISGWLLEWMCTAGVIFGRLEFQFNKLVELCWLSSSMDRSKRDSLACFLNICPSLEKLFVKMNRTLSSITCQFFHHYWHEPHLWMDYEMVKSNTSQLKHLKMFSLAGFLGDEDEVLLMELLLSKAVVLESMTIT